MKWNCTNCIRIFLWGLENQFGCISLVMMIVVFKITGFVRVFPECFLKMKMWTLLLTFIISHHHPILIRYNFSHSNNNVLIYNEKSIAYNSSRTSMTIKLIKTFLFFYLVLALNTTTIYFVRVRGWGERGLFFFFFFLKQ